MTRARLLLMALVAALSLVAVGCGGDDGGDEKPGSLLAEAASKRVQSGEMRMRASADIPGFPILGDKLELSAEGPFAVQRSGDVAADWDVMLRAGGQSFPAKLSAVDGKGYVDFQGLSYEVDPETFGGVPRTDPKGPSLESMGIDPNDWLKGQKVEDGDDIGGDSTRLVTGTVDKRAVLEDLLEIVRKPEVRDRMEKSDGPWSVPEIDEESLDRAAEAIKSPQVEVNVDEEGYARRVFTTMRFEMPEGVKNAAFDGGTVSFELVLEEIGARVDVVPPSNPRPLSDLLNFAGLIFGVEKPSDFWTVPR